MTRLNWLSVVASTMLLCAHGASAHPQVCYELTRIDANEPETPPLFATDLNDKGVVVGLTDPSTVEGRHAFMWQDGEYTDLHTLIDPTATFSEALGVNKRSEIIGDYVDVNGVSRNFLLTRGQEIDVETVPGSGNSAVRSINQHGQVAGLTFDFGTSLGYIWYRGKVTLLQGLGSSVSDVGDINDRGVVVGTSNVEQFRLHAVIWQGGQIMDLGVLPGFFDSRGVALNNHGQVIGQMIGATVRGFLWQDGETTLLPILPGYQFSGPFSINDAGQIVGGSEASTAAVATLWTDELMPIDLNTLICADDPLLRRVTLDFARRINKRGQIVATGRDTELLNQVRSFLLTPTH